MSEKKTCSTCSCYGSAGNDWSMEHNAGACGHRKLMIVHNVENVPKPLTDQLVIFNKRQMKVSPGFGCIHWRSSSKRKEELEVVEEEITQDESLAVCRGMRKYGGHFVLALAEALVQADEDNTKRIKNTWPEYWKKYLNMKGVDHEKGS